MVRVFHFAQKERKRGRPVLCASLILMLAGLLSAQETPANSTPPAELFGVPHGIPEDWSTQHVIYTQNGSIEDMMAVRGDPRFLNSFLLHHGRLQNGAQNGLQNGQSPQTANAESDATQLNETQANPAADAQNLELLPPTNRGKLPPHIIRNSNTKVDWAYSLGPTFGMAIGESPAKYTFNPSAAPTCENLSAVPPVYGDFVVFSLKAPPTKGSQANLIALTNLYTDAAGTGFCSGTGPVALFSYAIGTGGSLLSPVLSLNGSKVAWIENTTANHAVLHVTTWVAGQGTNATTGSVAIGSGSSDVALDYTSSAYSGCAASVDTNTNSEIYVDYPTDTAFVGADNGILYHVKGIFKGTPTFDFCIDVNTAAGTGMSGGVYDALLSPPELFITDSKKVYAYQVTATGTTPGYTLLKTVTYGAGTLTGPGPILDAFNNFLYVFSADDLNGNSSVTQLTTSLASSTVTALGPANTNTYPILFYGTFDNNYLTNGPKGANSTLYSCGTDKTTTTAQDLFAVGFVAATGVLNTTPVMPANKNVNPGGLNGTCSPITEFYDGTTDRIFVGMGEHVASTGANIVQMWNVTSQLTSATTTPTASASPYIGGPSGLVIDNNAGSILFPQAESVYFSTLVCATPNGTTAACGNNNCCAVKLTQSALK
jgi:hypothetical protein